jgi:hypothetical protein
MATTTTTSSSSSDNIYGKIDAPESICKFCFVLFACLIIIELVRFVSFRALYV